MQKKPPINIYGGIGGYEARTMALDVLYPLPPLLPVCPTLSSELLSQLPGYEAMSWEAYTESSVVEPTIVASNTRYECQNSWLPSFCYNMNNNYPALNCPENANFFQRVGL